jgi:acetyl esterase/lipase
VLQEGAVTPLDIAYQVMETIPDGAEYPDRWADAAADWRGVEMAVGRARLNQAYGPEPRQKLDLFLPAGRPEGLIVFVHGGFWRRFDRSLWSHFAAGGTAAGWAVAMPSYTLAPEARISAMTRETAAAIAEAARLVPSGPVVLAGHSAGGHLAARMLMADAALPEAVASRLRRVVPISPLSDLRPLLAATMNEILRLDPAEAAAESPALHPPVRDVPVTVWVGGAETPVFLDHARWLAEAWSCPLVTDAGRHHFDVLDGLQDPASPLMTALLRA